MRLIDADALTFELEEWKKNPNNDDSAVDLVNHFIGIIRATPSANAVEVVRCKGCKHKYVSGNGTTQYYVCDFMDAQYEEDGFCHHGKAR